MNARGNSTGPIHDNTIRQPLCNLASFLGKMTLGMNRPVLASDLNVKQLLIEAYFTQRTCPAIHITCFILKECPDSSVFRNSNPWVKSILQLLAEIH
jgi:CCR4-NOT transcription complex subunit 1